MNGYIEEFIKLRGTLFTNGIVVKEFVDFKKYGPTTNEYRAFYMNGNLLTISKNSNQLDDCSKAPIEFVELFTGLNSNFYTVDFAELENGQWIVIEVGDGQVSGLSPNQYVFKFYDEIRAIIQKE
ncbi:MAG: ATP-grasp domain-containing protein, partial [Bacillota bacterium]|nr:ATP-grasp domain-containing protein [Bacillota bacterium]